MTKRVGIFGGSGFIGSHVVKDICAAGCEAVIFDGREPALLPTGASFVATDLLDARARQDSVSRAGRIDAAVWLAATIRYETRLNEETDKDLGIMVAAPLAVLDQVGRELVSFIYLSSVEVYGHPVRLPIDENHPTDPAFPFGATKLCAEHYLRIACDTLHVPFSCLRLAYVYGPGQHPGNVIPRFVSAVQRSTPPVVFGSGADQRDDVYVADVAAAVVSSLAKRFNGTLNIASGKPHSLRDVAEAACRAGGGKLVPLFEDRPSSWINRWFDISRAADAIGYAPTAFESGMASFWLDARRT